MKYLLLALLLVFGCESGSVPAPKAKEQPKQIEESLEIEGDFFGDALGEEAAQLGSDFSVVPCVGATPEEQANLDHPRILRGQVVAPFGRLAQRALWDFIVPDAHAVPVGGENTVPNQEIQLVEFGSKGEPLKVLATATSDALGRYCLKLPKDVNYGVTLGLRTGSGDNQLRALVLSRGHSNISLSTEVVLALALEKGQLESNRRAWLVNLHTYADSAVDLLDPFELKDGTNVVAGKQEVKTHLLADKRFAAALNR